MKFKDNFILPILCYILSIINHWSLPSIIASILFPCIYYIFKNGDKRIISTLWLSCAVYNTFVSSLKDRCSIVLFFIFAHIFFSYFPFKKSSSHRALLIYCCFMSLFGFYGGLLFLLLSHTNIYYIFTVPVSDLSAWWGFFVSVYILAAVEHTVDWYGLLKVYFKIDI